MIKVFDCFNTLLKKRKVPNGENMTNRKILDDRDLERVTGGVAEPTTLDITDINVGDFFNICNDTFLVSRVNLTNISKNTSINFDMYYDDINLSNFITSCFFSLTELENYGAVYEASRSNPSYIPK